MTADIYVCAGGSGDVLLYRGVTDQALIRRAQASPDCIVIVTIKEPQ